MSGLTEMEKAGAFLRARFDVLPNTAVVAGSGLGAIVNYLTGVSSVEYGEIPDFPVSTVLGHSGKLIIGLLDGKPLAVFAGRKHLYEEATIKETTFAVRLMARLGVKYLILSNSAGGVSTQLYPGDLMLLVGYVNLSNRLRLRFSGIPVHKGAVGHPCRGGLQQPDSGSSHPRQGWPTAWRMGRREYCSDRLGAIAREVAAREGIPLREGIYCVNLGPTFETPSEARFAQWAGADAVGMSTVPEMIEAACQGLETLAISCITNSHVHGAAQTTHDEVIETAKRVEDRFVRLVKGIVRGIQHPMANAEQGIGK